MTQALHKRTDLMALTRDLGGDLLAGSRRALIPAPGHSAADRSVPLLLEADGSPTTIR